MKLQCARDWPSFCTSHGVFTDNGLARTPLQIPLLSSRTPSGPNRLGFGSLKAASEMENCLQKVYQAALWGNTSGSNWEDRIGKRERLMPNGVAPETSANPKRSSGLANPSEGLKQRQGGWALPSLIGKSLPMDCPWALGLTLVKAASCGWGQLPVRKGAVGHPGPTFPAASNGCVGPEGGIQEENSCILYVPISSVLVRAEGDKNVPRA